MGVFICAECGGYCVATITDRGPLSVCCGETVVCGDGRTADSSDVRAVEADEWYDRASDDDIARLIEAHGGTP